jgi:hypothetical protein
MKPEELDRMLSEEADIVPSPGFVTAVMEAVTTEAKAPLLTFPWTRAWPLAAGLPGLLLWLAILQFRPEVTTPGPDLYAWFEMIVPMATEWVAGGLLMTVAMTAWSLRLVRLR